MFRPNIWRFLTGLNLTPICEINLTVKRDNILTPIKIKARHTFAQVLKIAILFQHRCIICVELIFLSQHLKWSNLALKLDIIGIKRAGSPQGIWLEPAGRKRIDPGPEPCKAMGMTMTRARFLFLPLLLSALVLSGCSSLIVGAAATGDTGAVERRSVGDAVNDFSIRAELNRIFIEDDINLLTDVSFSVIEGRVLLKGAVEKYEHRVRALELAWRAAGVNEVINQIQVTKQGDFADYARDTWISAQLKMEILFDTDIVSINYNIETINGIIYIVGIAQDQAEIDKIVDRARQIKNVKKIFSHEIMKDNPRRAPGS